MKRINILLVSIFTVLIGTFLSACNFKNQTAEFSVAEIKTSIGQETNLDDYLETKEVDKNEITFKFSNSSLFSISDHTITALTHGQTMVYATYQNNILADMKLIVKKPFEQVANIKMDDMGLVTWNKVVDKFDETEDFTSPSQYKINFAYENMDTGEQKNYDEYIATNSFQLVENGKYTLSIIACGEGNFDNSQASYITVYFGYMAKLIKSDFSFDSSTNIVTWSSVSDASYSVIFNGEVISEKQSDNFIDISSSLETLDSGSYELSVVVHDKNSEKISVESESISINKLNAPTFENLFDEEKGGRYQISAPEHFKNVEIKVGDEYTFNFTENITETTFEGVAEGKYQVFGKAFANSGDEQGVFYADSDSVELGKIYKLGKLTLQGTGENEEDATTFNFNVERNFDNYESNIKVVLSGVKENEYVENGFTLSEKLINKEVIDLESGSYNLSAFEFAGQQNVNIEGEDFAIINGDESEKVNFVKLDAFQEFDDGNIIKHSYVEDNSVFEFNTVPYATNYCLYVKNGEDYNLVENNLYDYADGKITFNGKVENLFTENISEQQIEFKLVAENEDRLNYIFSSTLKSFEILDTPTSDGGNVAGDVFTFDAVENAGSYLVRYAVLDKASFESGVDDIETESLSFTTKEIFEESITLVSGNYYYVEIVANPENSSLYLTSNVFKKVFYLSKPLEIPVVSFGYNESYKGVITDASGYFLKVESVENLESLVVTKDTLAIEKYTDDGKATIYLFTDSFSGGKTSNISVVAHSVDPTIYTDSLPYNLEISRIKRVEYSDLIFDELTKNLTVKGGIEGAKNIHIYESESNQVERPNTDTTLPVWKITNSSIQIDVDGSALNDEYFEIVDNKVYLDSETATFNIRRLEKPTEFAFYNGNLTFTATPDLVEYFVLDMFVEDANGAQTLLKVNLTSPEIDVDVYKVQDEDLLLIEQDIKLTPESEIVTGEGEYTIDFNALLTLIKGNEKLYAYYSQSLKVEFSLYSYVTTLATSIYLSSYNATLKDNASGDRLIIEKMESPVISYNKETSNLSWQKVGEESAETEYVVYDVSSGEKQEISRSNATSYVVDLSKLTLSTDYKYVVVAINPYYLESGESNEILIHKLSGIDKVKLSDNKLQLSALTQDANFVEKTILTIDDGDEISITNYEHTISAVGNYKFKFVATESFESEGKFYIDSSVSSFTVNNLSSIAPSDTTVKFVDNTVSFETFGQDKNLQSLKYLIIFVDEQGNMAQVSTKENSFVIDGQDELNPLNKLIAGKIDIKVYAVLDAYNISSGGEVFFNTELSLVNGEKIYNAFEYSSDKSISKLSIPIISNIEFVENNDPQRPTMKLTVSGNYSTNETLLIFVGNYTDYIFEYPCIDAEENVVEIAFDQYSDYFAVGEETEIFVYVKSNNNLPSSFGSAKVYRSPALVNLEQNRSQDSISYVQNVTFTFESEEVVKYATGGITLIVNYTTNDEEKTETINVPADTFVDGNKITYSLTNFFNQNMKNGGQLYYQAFVNNYSNSASGKYCLSSESISTETYYILESPSDYIEKVAGGIIIGEKEDGTLINSENTKYVVTKGSERFEITLQDGRYYFEYPTDWENGSHTFTVVAMQDNMINSNVATVNLEMQRLEKVNNIIFKREQGLQDLTLSWDAVANADSYMIRAYADNDILINEFETSSTSFLMTEIFGENYEKLGSYISQGAQIRFEITSCSNSNTFNNSSIQYVNADFLGTNITVLDFVVGEDGQLYFKTEAGKDYMYRVVDVSGAEYLGWQQITADAESYVIDLTQIETLTSANTFRVQVITTGNAETSGIIYNDDAIKLVIDSAMVASEDAFMLSPTAHEVKPHYTDLSKVCVSLEDQNSVIYASLSSNYDFDNVIKLDIDYANILEDNGYYLYQMDYTGIFDMFGITETTNIYFFVKKSGEEANYVISKPFEYEFKIDNSTSFISIEKNVVSDEEDYVNTYLTYEKQDGEDMDKVLNNFDIQGFYIKIVHTSLEGEVTTIKAIYNKINLVEDIFEDKIALNITYLLSEDCLDVDENPVDQGAGSYKIYISNIKVVNEGTEDEPVYITYFSPYVETTTGGEEFVFEKLPEMSSVYLNNGDLYWTYDAEMMGKVTKYYIYYISTSNYKDYNIYKTQNNTQNSYSGLLFAGDSNAYNISVQPVSSDPKIIAGNEKYVADSDGTPINVVKNRFNNTLHLSTNGTLSVNWNANVEDSTTDHDIYKLLKQENITAEMANDFIHETIYYPFTFNVSELVYGSTKVRFRFTSYRTDDKSEIAFRRSVDVDAIYLLGNIINEGFTLEEFEGKLDEISNLLVNTADKNIVRDFKSVIKARMGGIGNYINIFDDFFEIVQEGKYEIEYCLLGNSSTLNSVWYQLTQDDGSKDFYINPTPSVVADRSDEPVDGISYEYFIKVRQSNIYLKDGSKEPAKTYFIQMKTNNETKKYGFEISTQDSGNTWSLKMVGNDNVASYNIDQEVVSENEKYLIIYFNLHDGCSIKAQYNDYVKNEDFALELFAQGNAVSLSSKSSRFTVSFYNACDSFKIEDGKFSWISHLNNPTNILYKFKDDNKEQPATAVAEQNRMSYFSLEGKPTGLYEYIKFVTEGRVEGNTIRIDSEVYTINNVYKLNSPSLNTSLNLISVDDTANDKFYTDKAYSDNEFHRFKVYNDISTENSSYIFPSGEAVGYYQPGITNYLSTDVDYAYKATEESASKFYFTSLGSTATFSTILDSSDASHNNYTFKIAGHEDEDLSVCVMSSVKEFNAKMLKPVSDILVGNGIITWNNFNVLGEETYDEENYSMVYKVTMSFYERNNSSAGTTEDIVGTPIECYTTKTMFDTSKVEDKFPQGSYSFLKVTIQAMILSLVENPTSENYVELVEGGYAQGQNITYTSISNNILISNGEEINDIQFSKPVTNIKVISDEGDTYGKISWEYSGNANFIVEDENGKEVSGSIANNSNTYIFTPNANELEGGEHKLTVYATSLDGGNVVKSNGVDITIYKLQNFGQNTDGDYEIFEDTKELSNGESMSVEIIDFSKYFDSIPENINATVNVSYQVEEESHNVILTKDNSTIIILTEALAENVTFKENESYIVIESSLDLTIKVTGKYADSTLFNILNADEYILHLERPKNNYVISWDTIKQIFTWQLEEGAEKQDEDAIVFVVTVNYLQGGMDGTIRRYEMTEKEFMPTIIHDSIKMELAVKFGEQGLMSSAVAYNGEQGDAVSFNLFTSGDGTSENPYVIDDENEFKNMQYRMTKPAYLNSYIEYQNGEPTQKTELERFYFEIKSKSNLNIQFEEEQGILFKGTFDGILRGNDSTINFTTKSVEKLTSNVVIKDGVVKSLESGQSTTTFSYGISLFENIGANSSISNLTITPNFTANEVITTHALISGLAINNRGTITNVSIGGMTSNLVVFKSTESLIGAYSGIVSVNSGTISSCSINGDIILSDTSSVSGEEKVYAENFFVGGICYTNYREIRNCVLRANISLSIGSNMMTTHQLAGFAVTSTETGTLSNNQIEANAGETYKVQITCLTTNQCRAYVAGIAVYGKGSINNNVSNEGCAVANNVTEPYIANDIVEGI